MQYRWGEGGVWPLKGLGARGCATALGKIPLYIDRQIQTRRRTGMANTDRSPPLQHHPPAPPRCRSSPHTGSQGPTSPSTARPSPLLTHPCPFLRSRFAGTLSTHCPCSCRVYTIIKSQSIFLKISLKSRLFSVNTLFCCKYTIKG
jgi:hypothetical protein